MLRIGLVDDDPHDRDHLISLLRKFESKNDITFKIKCFSDGEDLISHYTAEFDVILLDIEMKFLDGMRTAEELRKYDESVILIFITHMPQYALKGYRVGARDFLVKPITYFALEDSLKRVLRVKSKSEREYISINLKTGIKKLDVSRICYVEVQDHDMTYHTLDGNYNTKGTLREAEEALNKDTFFKCNRCYLVNLKHVDRFESSFAIVNGDQVQVSRSSRKQFLDALNQYISGEN